MIFLIFFSGRSCLGHDSCDWPFPECCSISLRGSKVLKQVALAHKREVGQSTKLNTRMSNMFLWSILFWHLYFCPTSTVTSGWNRALPTGSNLTIGMGWVKHALIHWQKARYHNIWDDESRSRAVGKSTVWLQKNAVWLRKKKKKRRCKSVFFLDGITLFTLQEQPWPIGSMYGIFTYIWVIHGLNVGKYSIHGSYGWWSLNRVVTVSHRQNFTTESSQINSWMNQVILKKKHQEKPWENHRKMVA